MIRRAKLIHRLHRELIPRLEVAHELLTKIVTILRDTSGWIVWTEAAPEGTGNRVAARWWIDHLTAERARLQELRDAGAGPVLERLYPELYDSARDYFVDVPVIVGYIQQAVDRHAGRNESLTNAERRQLADAIAALLEA